MTEELTVLDEHGVPIGTADRDTVHRQGWWHESFHCLVVRTTPPARVVLQRRRLGARGFPGLLDLSATGHLAAGEAPLDGVRELREELGIDVDPAALVPLGRRRLVDDAGEGRNREIANVYLLADDRPLDAFAVDPAEIAAVVEIAVDDLVTVLGDPGASVGATAWDGHRTTPLHVTNGDLVPDVDGYWAALAVAARRLVDGAPPAPV
jgi:isopentenyldiphosphate isomerase